VHVQDEGKKYDHDSYLQKLLNEPPIILHQEPNGGKVLIEKLEDSAASVGFAIVLLTGDDTGRAKQLNSADDRPRARQNVVFEMGFFFGLIGRGHVAVLYEPGLENPSDINGLVYIALDDAGAWKGKLASEMDHAGIAVDWTAIGRS
jgi:predicted nucleotide-binding protein